MDALGGWNEAEAERVKILANLIRLSTTHLVNIQLSKEDKISARDLWPLPWDESDDLSGKEVTEEHRKQLEERQKAILSKM